MNASAFNDKVNPMGSKIHALFSSDIGHFDVANMNEVLEEAHELVDEGVMSADDFRDFTFVNPVDFWTRGNPDFFRNRWPHCSARNRATLRQKGSFSFHQPRNPVTSPGQDFDQSIVRDNLIP